MNLLTQPRRSRATKTALASWPPGRYFVGNAGVAAVLVGIERAAHVSSGGINGLSLALSGALHWNLGVVNMLLKGIVFGVVWALGGGWAARWTMVSALMIGSWTILFSQLPLVWPWSHWIAVLLLVTIAYLPAGLVLSCGVSTGGYSALAQLVEAKKGMPLWMTLLGLNLLSVVAMFLVYGRWSGAYSLVATLGQGPAIHFWTRWAKQRWSPS